ncbi:MAG: hypothetical protein WD875_13615 [Pirellulales bacterium]
MNRSASQSLWTRFFPIFVAVAAIVSFASHETRGEPAAAADTTAGDPTAGDTVADGVDDLNKTLSEVLRARRPEEFAFIDRVVELVDHGTLPRDLVVSTFNWARKKPHHPFQYFEFGLRERAKKIGVHI